MQLCMVARESAGIVTTYSPTGRGRPMCAWDRPGSARLRPHGTRAARRRHTYRDEPLCPLCGQPVPAPPRGLPCGCPPVVPELEDTLGLPHGYAWTPGVGWVHE